MTEYRRRLASNPLDFKAMILLIEMMAASGPPELIEKELAAWEVRLPFEVRAQALPPLRAIAEYDAGKLKDCEQRCRQLVSLQNSPFRLHAVLAQKRATEVILDPAFGKLWDDPWEVLATSLGLGLEGKQAEALRWRERAIGALESQGTETRLAAKVLRSREPAALTGIERVLVSPGNLALLCAALAERFPAKRAEYQTAAVRYNVRRNPPYQLVLRALEQSGDAAR